MADNIDKEFYLTRGEYAKKIGKSKGSVIQSMRRGGLTNEYIIRDSKYYFRDPQRPRAYQQTVHGPLYTPKRKINRGNHDKARYPNDALDNTMRLNVWPLFSTKYLKEFKTRYQKQLRELKKRNERQCKKLFVNIQVTKQLLGKILSIGVTAEC